jgi:ABC-type multidrug transport system ATPase subunit
MSEELDRFPDGHELVLHEITKRWRGAAVLDSLDLVLEPGTATLVAGRNGAGKTTLLRIAAGLIYPDSGIVLLHDLSPIRHRRAYQRRLGVVSAGDRGLYARMTVKQHLEFWARVSMIGADRRDEYVDRTVDRFALTELAPYRVDRLSMGQRQRVRLALAFLHEPDVLLLDEPRNSLDADGFACFAAALQAALDGGAVALWCSPTGEEQGFPFDRRLILESGKVVEA